MDLAGFFALDFCYVFLVLKINSASWWNWRWGFCLLRHTVRIVSERGRDQLKRRMCLLCNSDVILFFFLTKQHISPLRSDCISIKFIKCFYVWFVNQSRFFFPPAGIRSQGFTRSSLWLRSWPVASVWENSLSCETPGTGWTSASLSWRACHYFVSRAVTPRLVTDIESI